MAIKRIEQLEQQLNAKAKEKGNGEVSEEEEFEEPKDKDDQPIVTPDGEAVSCPIYIYIKFSCRTNIIIIYLYIVRDQSSYLNAIVLRRPVFRKSWMGHTVTFLSFSLGDICWRSENAPL